MPGLTNRRRAIQEGSDWTKGYSEGGSVKKYAKGGAVGEDPLSKKEREIYRHVLGQVYTTPSEIAERKKILLRLAKKKGSVSEREMLEMERALPKSAKKARKRSAKK